MKLRSVLLLLLCLFTFSSLADEQRKVTLDDTHSQEMIRLAYANIFIIKGETDANDRTDIRIEIENLDETNVLLVFGHAFPEKELKKQSPKITFDKQFGGTKGKRLIDTFKYNNRQVSLVDPSDKFAASAFQVQVGETTICRIPIYVAKYKGKNKKNVILLEKQVLELELTVKADEDIIRLTEAYQVLVAELDTIVFCTNAKHQEDQKQPFIEKINKIKNEIEGILSSRGWAESSVNYQKYIDLKKQVEAIDLSVVPTEACSQHRTVARGHSCKYDSFSLQEIYHKLDDYYKKIYNSSDRKAAKAEVMADVNLLYRCCTDPNCRQHAAAWRRGGDYKNRIIDRYNRINNF